MAEGSPNPDRDNPFSFKSFVTKKDKKVTADNKASSDDDIDIFDLPDVSSQRKRDKPKQIVVVDEDETKQGQQKKKGKSENPFSFKKFLSGSSGKGKARSSPLQQHKSVPKVNTDDNCDDLPDVPNLHVAGDLPDFVQDHYSESIGTSSRGLELPDFTLPGVTDNGPDIGDSNFLSTDYSTIEIREKSDHRQDLNADVNSDFDDNSDLEDSVPPQGNLVNRLPDFLSDAAVSSSKHSDSVNSSAPIVTRNSRKADTHITSGVELQKLQDENLQLKRQLEELRTRKLNDAERISELQQQMVEQKKKEVEETKAMEHAMEQVEKNLSATTKRAVLAESTVTKLKQEVKTLQTEIKALKGENGMLPSDQHLNDVKERTSYVAEQLSNATKTAETSLRQLLSGVDNLKLLSQVLNSIDKISEDTSTNKTNPDNS